MRRRAITSLMILVLALVLALGSVSAALAAPPANDGAGAEFGAHHAEHARAGHLGQDMNPGMHDGFAGWMAGHEH